MNTYNRLPVSFARGEGAWLWDDAGNRYLDALAGIAVSIGRNEVGALIALLVLALSLIGTVGMQYTPQITRWAFARKAERPALEGFSPELARFDDD